MELPEPRAVNFLVWFAGHVPLVVVFVLGSVLLVYLFGFYRSGESAERARYSRWAARWNFTPSDLGGNAYSQLALASVAGLFFELLMIRWISSEIPIFAYLKNFVLIACFLGFGLGCYLCRRRVNLIAGLLPLLAVTLLIKAPWADLRWMITSLHAFVGALAEVETWGLPNLPRTWYAWQGLVTTLAVVVPLFALVAFIFIPLGQLVGWYLERACRGISGYTVNILASLAGILLFTVLAFLSQPPPVWLAVAGVLLVALLWRVPRLRATAAIGMALIAGMATWSADSDFTIYWSPYQKLAIRPLELNGELYSYELSTNDSWYQQIFNLSPGFVAAHPDQFKIDPIEWNPYNLPYHFYPNPPSVLVLGSGTGNDVAAALRNGAGEVTAVEIDPLILRLGRQLHFEHPYSSPRVHAVNDDARSFLGTSPQRFDLILFSLLDSHTTNAYYSNIRIDNFVYTVEAMAAARRLLRPDGILVIKYWVETPWIGGRLHDLAERTFGRPPIHIQASRATYGTTGRFFICGSPERIAQALQDPALSDYVARHRHLKTEPARLTTDDWPYFYQREPGLPTIVVLISAALLPVCWLLVRTTGTRGRSLEWHFFFLGAGFLLLETQIISKMALVFGTTWVVNSIVIAGLLLLIIAANLVVERRPRVPVGLAYAGIFTSILVAFLVPVRALLFPALGLKILAATFFLCLPVFFAGIVFIRSFAAAGFRGEALGSNLFGALVGGLLESFSFWFGLRSLLLLAAGLYLASWLALALQAPVPAREQDLEPGLGAPAS
jgi:spermidine synthase